MCRTTVLAIRQMPGTPMPVGPSEVHCPTRGVMEVKPAMQGGRFVQRERGKHDRLQPEAEKG